MFRLISHYIIFMQFFSPLLHFIFSLNLLLYFPSTCSLHSHCSLNNFTFFSTSSQLYLFQLLHTNFSKNILSPLTLLSHFILSLNLTLISPFTFSLHFSTFSLHSLSLFLYAFTLSTFTSLSPLPFYSILLLYFPLQFLSLIYGFTFLFHFIPLLSPYTSECTFSHNRFFPLASPNFSSTFFIYFLTFLSSLLQFYGCSLDAYFLLNFLSPI